MTGLTPLQIRSNASRKGAETRKRAALARGGGSLTCTRCGAPRDRTTGVECKACHAARMREWRKDHRLAGEARAKDTARSYAGVYKRRGELIAQPCQHCGNPKSEMHHADYSRPLDVIWVCRACHMRLHHPAPLKRGISRVTHQEAV